MSDDARRVHCEQHGSAFETYICDHLARNPRQTWYSSAPNADNPWPDSWCSICNAAYLREGQWNNRNESELKIRLFCHRCHESHRAQGVFVEVPDYEIPD